MINSIPWWSVSLVLSLLLGKELLRFSYGVMRKWWFKEEWQWRKWTSVHLYIQLHFISPEIHQRAHTHTHTHILTHPPPPPQPIKELVRSDAEVRGFPGGSVVKDPPAMQKMRVWSLGWEDPLKEESTTSFSKLVWRIPWTEALGGLQSIESQRVRHDWATEHTHILDVEVNHHLALGCFLFSCYFSAAACPSSLARPGAS